MEPFLEPFLRVAIALFMAASLFEVGLRVAFDDARAALADWRFALVSALWAFGICPALAVAVTRVLPLQPPHAMGLVLLAMAPGAPFLPAAASRARGDLPHAAAFVLLASLGTVILMPLVVPAVVVGATTDAWTIARPLVLLVLLPLVAGVALRAVAAGVARRIQRAAGIVAGVASLHAIAVFTLLYARDFVGAAGSYAIAALLAFLVLATAGAYLLSGVLPEPQRRVLALGVCTRNVGAAAAPLLAGGVDRRAMVMVALAVPTTVLSAALVSRWLSHRDVRR